MSKTPAKSSKSKGLQLGRAVEWPHTPDQAQIDRVPNPQRDTNYVVRFTAPEFTSLCPVTGQPDFAHLVIDYAPAETIVESKSLKLFLGSYRSHCGLMASTMRLPMPTVQSSWNAPWLRKLNRKSLSDFDSSKNSPGA